MSRHFYDCKDSLGRSIRIRLGFDRPLQEFFMHVELCEADEILYASINDPFDKRELDYYQRKLAELELAVPPSMWREVINDAVYGAANRCVQHFSDGRVVEGVLN